MVGVHFSTIPRKRNIAYRHIERHIFCEMRSSTKNIVYARFEGFRTFTRYGRFKGFRTLRIMGKSVNRHLFCTVDCCLWRCIKN